MNPLNYSLAEIQKAVIQLVSAAILIAGFFIVFDPGFDAAAIAVVGAIFGVISVFGMPNVSADDITKAVQSLIASVIGLVAVLGTDVDPSVTERWLSIAALAIPPIFVFAKGQINSRAPSLQ